MQVQVGYPVLTLTEDGSTSQARFLALAASGQAAATSTKGQGTSWNIPVKVVWEGDGEMSVMLTGEADGGEGGRKLKEAAQSLQSQGKWFKVRSLGPCCSSRSYRLDACHVDRTFW